MVNEIKTKKRVVMVLGMARSGTSAIARGLKAIGVDLGEMLHEPDKRNPKGFWEDNDVNYRINRHILRSMNYPWICRDLAERMQLQDDDMLNAMKRYAVKLVQERLTKIEMWGFKDTNTAVLLPFWQSVLSAVNVEDSYVIALRNPLGCAHSNIKHSNLELEAGLLAWLKNIILAVDGSRGKKCAVVSYDLLLQNPPVALQHMAHGLAIKIKDLHEIEVYAGKFVDHTLHHHAYVEADLMQGPAVASVPLCAQVYTLMMKLASGALSFTDQAFILEWDEIRKSFDNKLPLYDYANNVLKQSLQIERDMRALNKSFFWKALYPLRVIDAGLRRRRKAARLTRRLVKAYG
jgi:hypothetical protein